MAVIGSFGELRVYKAAFAAAMRIFALTKQFPPEERFSMVDQYAPVLSISLRQYRRGMA
jgi:hypothetical protein